MGLLVPQELITLAAAALALAVLRVKQFLVTLTSLGLPLAQERDR
jgi:hypothetical protein